MARIFVDLSHSIHDGLGFQAPWHTPVKITLQATHDTFGRETRRFTAGTHDTGTHVDAPRHFVPGGTTVERIPLNTLIGPALLADFRDARPLQELTPEDFRIRLGDQCPKRLVLNFGWSRHWNKDLYYEKNPFLSEAAARWLINRGVNLIGMDSPQLDHPRNGHGTERDSPIHRLMLGAGVVFVENLTNLNALPEGQFELLVLPIPIHEGDGAPARCAAILEV